MYEWITAIASATTIVSTIIAALHYYTQRHASKRQSIIEVLNDIVIPLLNKIEKYESKCQYISGETSILTLPIDVKSDILHRRFVGLLKKYHYYKEFQREVNEFNNVQQALQKKVEVLKSTLAIILQGDKRIQVLWEEKVKKAYPDWDYAKAQNAIIQEFISSWCDDWPGGVWYIFGEELWREYCDKVKDVLNEVNELIERRRQIARKLREMLKRVLDKVVEGYNILDSELRKGEFEIV